MRAVLYIDGQIINGDIVEVSLSRTMDDMIGGAFRSKAVASVQVALRE